MPNLSKPFLKHFSCEPMSVVRTYIVWSPICYEERIWRLRDISGAHFMRHMNSACLVSIFIHHSQHFIGTEPCRIYRRVLSFYSGAILT